MPVIPVAQYEKFAQMWVDDVPVSKIALHFDTSPYWVEKLRASLSLERRSKWKHGQSAYSTGKCRCGICTDANTERHRRENARRYADRPKDPLDPRHGTASFYSNHGCRCTACRGAWAVFCKKLYAGRKARGLSNKKSPLPK